MEWIFGSIPFPIRSGMKWKFPNGNCKLEWNGKKLDGNNNGKNCLLSKNVNNEKYMMSNFSHD